MAEQMANMNKRYSPQGIVPDIERPITLTDSTFGVHPTTSGARVYVTIPETGFYEFNLNNGGVGTYQNIGFEVAICDSNNNIVFSMIDLRNYLSSGSWGVWATIKQSCFLEKDTRVTIMALSINPNGFKVNAYKAKAITLD